MKKVSAWMPLIIFLFFGIAATIYTPNTLKWPKFRVFNTLEQTLQYRIIYDVREFNWYADEASWIRADFIPYIDFPYEYPVLATALFTVPALFGDDLTLYHVLFRFLMVLVGAGLIIVTLKELKRNKQEYLIWILFLPSILYFTINRFDIVPAFALQCSLILLFRKRWAASFIFLAVSILFKWYAGILFPLYLLVLFDHATTREERTAGFRAVVLSIALLLIGHFWVLAAGGTFLDAINPYSIHFVRSPEAGSLVSDFIGIFNPSLVSTFSLETQGLSPFTAAVMGVASLLQFLTLLFTFQPSSMSADFTDYILCAQHLTEGRNPYQTLCNINQTRGYIYGPVFLFISSASLLISNGNVAMAHHVLKGFILLTHMLIIILLFQILTQFYERNKALLGSLVYATSPIILHESLQGGHNDVFLVATFLGTLLAFSKRYYTLAHLILIVGGLIKLVPLFLIPFLSLATFFAIRQFSGQRVRYSYPARLIAVTLTGLVLGSLPYIPLFFHNVLSLVTEDMPVSFGVLPIMIYGFTSLIGFSFSVSIQTATTVSSLIFALFILSLFFQYARQKVSSIHNLTNIFFLALLILLLTSIHWVVPWYLLWLYPFILLLIPFPRSIPAMVLANIAGALSIVVPVSLALLLTFCIVATFWLTSRYALARKYSNVLPL